MVGGGQRERRVERTGHAAAILEATVLSLSSFALFFSNACCLQLSRFWHSWCSGMRCCRGRGHSQPQQGRNNGKETYLATELETAVGALANDAENGLVATGLRGLELATLLGRHDGCRVRGCGVREALERRPSQQTMSTVNAARGAAHRTRRARCVMRVEWMGGGAVGEVRVIYGGDGTRQLEIWI